jgi:hypothetical protein
MTRRQEHRPATLRMTRTIDGDIPFTAPDGMFAGRQIPFIKKLGFLNALGP